MAFLYLAFSVELLVCSKCFTAVNGQTRSTLPPGLVKYGEQWVQSKPISFNGHKDAVYVKGRFDIVVEFDDDTYGVIDFKTGNPDGERADLYSRQLHAYACALENPAPRTLGLSPITKLGLLYCYPTDVSQTSIEELSYDSEIHWVEIERNDDKFMSFLRRVLTILEFEIPPPATPGCIWCECGDKMKKLI